MEEAASPLPCDSGERVLLVDDEEPTAFHD